MAAAEETVVLNLNLAAETEGAPEAIAKVGEALKGLATDADEAQKALARVTPAESLNQMADWVSKTAGADAAAKLMQNMTQEGNSLGAALEKTGEAAAVTAPAIAAVAQETAAAVPIVEASVAVTEQATTAERAHENALKMLSSGIKEYGLQAEGARELVEAFAKDEELTAEETTGLQRELGLLGDATEETGQVTKATGIAFGEMFGDMAAASKGAQESKGILQDVADEGSAATDIVGQAHAALRSLRVGLGATGFDPSLTAMLGQATGLMGILDVVGPALPLVTNPAIVAAAASAGAFWLVHEATVGKAMRELEQRKGWEAEAQAAAQVQGILPYRPTGVWAEVSGTGGLVAPGMMTGMTPTQQFHVEEALKELRKGQVRVLRDGRIVRVTGEEAEEAVLRRELQPYSRTDPSTIEERRAVAAAIVARLETTGTKQLTPQQMGWIQAQPAGSVWQAAGGPAGWLKDPEQQEDIEWWREEYTGGHAKQRAADRAKAAKELADAQAAYAKEWRRQQEALASGEAARQREAVQGQYETGQVNWQDYIDRAPAEQRPALRIQYRHWQLQQQQRMQPSRAGEGDQGGEERLLELGQRVRAAEARVRGEPVPVIIVNPENTLGKAFKQGRRLEQVDQGL